MIVEHIILFFAWLIYYGLHSLFATERIKNSLSLSAKNYRLIYSLVASILLFVLLIYGATIYSVLLIVPSNLTTYLGLMISATGVFILKRSFRKYSLREFLGLKAENETQALVQSGLQAKMRHPLYLGTILVLLGYFFFNPQASNLIILISTLIYLPFGIRWEEQKLIKEFGDSYLEYKKTTPALFPKLW